MAVDRVCKGCREVFSARYSGNRYCSACAETAREVLRDRRRAAKHVLVCSCGQPKSRDYVHCTDCRKRTLEVQMREQSTRSTWQRAKFPNRLPVAPLAVKLTRFVDLHAEYDEHDNRMSEPVLKQLGICSRRYYEWRQGRSLQVTFPLADRILTAAGWDWAEVWSRETAPALFDALDAIDELGEAEADGFCPECSEWVASINGTCPWHAKPVRVELSVPFDAAHEGPDGSIARAAA